SVTAPLHAATSTLSLHDALPICADWKVREGKSGQLARLPYILGRDFSGIVSAVGKGVEDFRVGDEVFGVCDVGQEGAYAEKIAIDRKSTRLNSSHDQISYAVFCL